MHRLYAMGSTSLQTIFCLHFIGMKEFWLEPGYILHEILKRPASLKCPSMSFNFSLASPGTKMPFDTLRKTLSRLCVWFWACQQKIKMDTWVMLAFSISLTLFSGLCTSTFFKLQRVLVFLDMTWKKNLFIMLIISGSDSVVAFSPVCFKGNYL